jgi:hypothetical protein
MVSKNIIRKFFIKRFKRTPEQDMGYFEDWLRRFEMGEEIALKYMDDESKKVWKSVTKRRK